MADLYEPQKIIELQMPARVLFGNGVSSQTGAEAKKLGAKKTLVVTGRTVAKAGLAGKAIESLLCEKIPTETWSEAAPEPGIACVENLRNHVQKNKYDLIIGVGGGSTMDVAKAAAVPDFSGRRSVDKNWRGRAGARGKKISY